MILMTSCAVNSSRKSSTRVVSQRTAKAFCRIIQKGMCDVRFVQGNTYAVRVEGSKSLVDNVETTFRDSTLVINDNTQKRSWKDKINKKTVTIYVTSPDLVSVKLVGMGDFKVQGPLDTDTLAVELRGMGDIDLDDVICDAFDGTLIGMGDMQVGKLTSGRTTLLLKGMGDVDVHFANSGEVGCTLIGMGDITLTGNVSRLSKEKRGSGDIDVDGLTVRR